MKKKQEEEEEVNWSRVLQRKGDQRASRKARTCFSKHLNVNVAKEPASTDMPRMEGKKGLKREKKSEEREEKGKQRPIRRDSQYSMRHKPNIFDARTAKP